MFPLHQGGELCFKISPSPHQQDNIPQDLILAQYAEIHGSDMTNNMENGRQRTLISMDSNEVARDNKNNSMKKMMHRVIERQRRQEMAIHHASLRALLPLEFIRVRNLQFSSIPSFDRPCLLFFFPNVLGVP